MASQAIGLSTCSASISPRPARSRGKLHQTSRSLFSARGGNTFGSAKHAFQSGSMHALWRRCRQCSRGTSKLQVFAATAELPHLQLATAKLPGDVNIGTFVEKLYQWAATTTSSGRNLPLVLPLRVTRTKDGFDMSMLRMRDTTPVSVADITVTVEPVDGTGMVLFVRFYKAEGSDLAVRPRQEGNDVAYLRTLSQALVDVPTLMTSMPPAIKLAVVQSRN